MIDACNFCGAENVPGSTCQVMTLNGPESWELCALCAAGAGSVGYPREDDRTVSAVMFAANEILKVLRGDPT